MSTQQILTAAERATRAFFEPILDEIHDLIEKQTQNGEGLWVLRNAAYDALHPKDTLVEEIEDMQDSWTVCDGCHYDHVARPTRTGYQDYANTVVHAVRNDLRILGDEFDAQQFEATYARNASEIAALEADRVSGGVVGAARSCSCTIPFRTRRFGSDGQHVGFARACMSLFQLLADALREEQQLRLYVALLQRLVRDVRSNQYVMHRVQQAYAPAVPDEATIQQLRDMYLGDQAVQDLRKQLGIGGQEVSDEEE